MDVSKEQSSGFGALPSKRKFGSENKVITNVYIEIEKGWINRLLVSNLLRICRQMKRSKCPSQSDHVCLSQMR